MFSWNATYSHQDSSKAPSLTASSTGVTSTPTPVAPESQTSWRLHRQLLLLVDIIVDRSHAKCTFSLRHVCSVGIKAADSARKLIPQTMHAEMTDYHKPLSEVEFSSLLKKMISIFDNNVASLAEGQRRAQLPGKM